MPGSPQCTISTAIIYHGDDRGLLGPTFFTHLYAGEFIRPDLPSAGGTVRRSGRIDRVVEVARVVVFADEGGDLARSVYGIDCLGVRVDRGQHPRGRLGISAIIGTRRQAASAVIKARRAPPRRSRASPNSMCPSCQTSGPSSTRSSMAKISNCSCARSTSEMSGSGRDRGMSRADRRAGLDRAIEHGQRMAEAGLLGPGERYIPCRSSTLHSIMSPFRE
jgi:hypothetical protein